MVADLLTGRSYTVLTHINRHSVLSVILLQFYVPMYICRSVLLHSSHLLLSLAIWSLSINSFQTLNKRVVAFLFAYWLIKSRHIMYVARHTASK